MKREIRVLGIDDGPFQKEVDKSVLLVGVLFRGGNYLDGILSASATVDGSDATAIISRMVLECKFYKQLRAILLKGISVGGFNVIDVIRLNVKIGIPVIVVCRKMPDYDRIFSALRVLDMVEKIDLIRTIPTPLFMNGVYVQAVGCSSEHAKEILMKTTTHAHIPEPLRVAHMIASGMVLGESRGRA